MVCRTIKGTDLTICMGMNDQKYRPDEHKILSNIDFVVQTDKPVMVEAVNRAFREAAEEDGFS